MVDSEFRYRSPLASSMIPDSHHQRTGVNAKRVLLIAFQILTVVMFFSGAFGLWQYRRDLQTAAWPSVKGVVIHAQTRQCYFRGAPTGLSPDVAYKYVVNGQEWIGTRLDIKNHCAAEEVVRNYVAEFPAGSQVLVFYDPSSPAESLLHPGPGREQIDLFHLAEIQMCLSILLALFSVWVTHRQREKQH
jgi:hypothetical protein